MQKDGNSGQQKYQKNHVLRNWNIFLLNAPWSKKILKVSTIYRKYNIRKRLHSHQQHLFDPPKKRNFRKSGKRQSADSWPTVDRLSSDCWPTVGDCWPTVSRQFFGGGVLHFFPIFCMVISFWRIFFVIRPEICQKKLTITTKQIWVIFLCLRNSYYSTVLLFNFDYFAFHRYCFIG